MNGCKILNMYLKINNAKLILDKCIKTKFMSFLYWYMKIIYVETIYQEEFNHIYSIFFPAIFCLAIQFMNSIDSLGHFKSRSEKYNIKHTNI